MIITYHGASFFKIQFGDSVVAYAPVSKESKLKQTRFGADIALVPIKHADMNGVDQVAYGDRELYVVNGPGEYEVKEIFIKGFPSVSHYDGEDWINTIYTMQMEGMNLCFLGTLGEKELSKEVRAGLDEVDILFVPIGGQGVLDAADAYRLAVSIGPKLIIPTMFGEVGEKDALKTFLKEEGAKEVEPTEKLTLKRKDLDGKEGNIVVLKY